MNASEIVRHVMSAPPVSIDVDAKPSDVHALLTEKAFHHLPVLDRGVLVGMLSTLDLARVSLGRWVDDPSTVAAWLDTQFSVRELMTWEPEFVRDDDPVRIAADRLASGGFHSLPVLDASDRLVGIVTSTDLLRLLANG
ncbi:MAG: CBS domain-containing protein [Myxococcales bacterium]|nr:CBS domain-containing protein [Myxococcales bacterium]